MLPAGRGRLERALLRETQRPDDERDAAILRIIGLIPKGKTAAYSAVSAAAGYPLHHRMVARLLRQRGDALPWQRVMGVGGEIRLRMGSALEQRTRLEMEGVGFHGRRVAAKHILSSEDLICLRIQSESRKSRGAASRPPSPPRSPRRS